MKSNIPGPLEKNVSKTKVNDSQQGHNLCCLTQILCHLDHLRRHYEELQYRNQRNQTSHLKKEILKQKCPREVSKKFRVHTQEKQVKC